MANRELLHSCAFDIVMSAKPRGSRSQIRGMVGEVAAALALVRGKPIEVRTGYKDAMLALLGDSRKEEDVDSKAARALDCALSITS